MLLNIADLNAFPQVHFSKKIVLLIKMFVENDSLKKNVLSSFYDI